MFDIGGILVKKCMSLYLFEMYKLQLVLIDVCHGKHYNKDSDQLRSEEHTSELQSRETISYAVFCLKKKKKQHQTKTAPK